jgi:hypothetical protein
MPNHIHVLIAFRNTQGVSINSIIGEGKRFMSYGIVKRLKEKSEAEVLAILAALVNATDRKRGKRHEVFEPSFDWKECKSDKFINQKLDYIHANPCRGVWSLVNDETEYTHSSAKYYETGAGRYGIMKYTELEDIDLIGIVVLRSAEFPRRVTLRGNNKHYQDDNWNPYYYLL